MELFEIKTKTGMIYKMNRFPQEVKNDTLQYFVYGEGYKKTKRFNRIVANIPELNEELSWLEICKIHEVYGIDVSNEYAEQKTAGFISKRTVLSKYWMYSKIKDILNTIENSEWFFNLLSCDHTLSMFGIYSFDIIELDKVLNRLDSEYDNINCLYKGKNVSMSEYIDLKYGKQYTEMIDRLLEA